MSERLRVGHWFPGYFYMLINNSVKYIEGRHTTHALRVYFFIQLHIYDQN